MCIFTKGVPKGEALRDAPPDILLVETWVAILFTRDMYHWILIRFLNACFFCLFPKTANKVCCDLKYGMACPAMLSRRFSWSFRNLTTLEFRVSYLSISFSRFWMGSGVNGRNQDLSRAVGCDWMKFVESASDRRNISDLHLKGKDDRW